MTMPSIKRLRELSVKAMTEWDDPDDDEGFINHLLETIRADGYEPSEEELAVVGREMIRQIEYEATREAAKEEALRLLEEWKAYAGQWDAWVAEVVEAEGDAAPVLITMEEDYVFMGETLMIPGPEFERITSMFLMLHDRVAKTLRPFPEVSIVKPANGNSMVKMIRTVHQLAVEARVQWERHGRLVEKQRSREGSYAPPEPRRCSTPGCQKPVAANDLCKKHGREAGLVPRGKVEDVKLSKRERRRIEREETNG